MEALLALAGLELHLSASRASAAWFLPFALPISAWVVWHDLATMRIPNRTVLLLAGCFLVAGLFALPLPDYGWRVAQMVLVLAVGFLMNQFGGVGAGDVKFAAAAAGMIAPGDLRFLLLLFAAVMLAAFATHRLFCATGAGPALAPHWRSWSRRDFPMGFALGTALAIYLLLVLGHGS